VVNRYALTQPQRHRGTEAIFPASTHPHNSAKSLRERYPEIPWRDMAGIRDRLVHGYFKVDLSIVWTTVTIEFPELRSMLENVLADMDR